MRRTKLKLSIKGCCAEMQMGSGEGKWYMESQTTQNNVTPQWNAREIPVFQCTSSVNTHASHVFYTWNAHTYMHTQRTLSTHSTLKIQINFTGFWAHWPVATVWRSECHEAWLAAEHFSYIHMPRILLFPGFFCLVHLQKKISYCICFDTCSLMPSFRVDRPWVCLALENEMNLVLSAFNVHVEGDQKRAH